MTEPIVFTRNERRVIARRTAGWLDDGRRATPTAHLTEPMARAVFDNYDPDLIFTGERDLVEWCPHTDQYRYDHGCDDGCERPVPKVVWVASWPRRTEGDKP